MAQPAGDLAAARARFAEALQDEEEGRPAVALEKFRSVREVRDTAAVEYRIGRCLEDLGRAAEAVAAYEQSVALSRRSATPSEVESDALDRSAVLGRGLARLTIALSPPDARVLIDETPTTRLDDIPLTPGPHHIHAVRPSSPGFDGDITLPPGGRATIKVSLGTGAGAQLPATPASSRRLWGWIAVATGSALLLGGGVSLVAREEDIQTADRLCPGGACRGAIDPQAQSAVERARFEGPLAVGLGAAAAVCAGVGIALLTTGSSPSILTVTPSVGATGFELSLRGAL